MKKSIIVAMASNHAIGHDNKLMWHIPEDLQRFKKYTSGHHVIMGRKTYESIIEQLGKPLPNRVSIVVTRNKDYEIEEGGIVVSSIEDAYQVAENAGENEVFIIGGGEIYSSTIDDVDTIYLTKLMEMYNGADTYFPAIYFDQYTIRSLDGSGNPTIDRKIYRNFPGETHDHEFMILDRIKEENSELIQ